MLYPKNQTKTLDKELFSNPTSEYRGAPFWAWNCKLKKEEMLEQIENFKTMGMGGFHIHVRTGMASPYLDDEFMDYVGFCIDEAKKRNMLSWLYDEDRWPSGSCGGLVSQNPEFVMRNMLFTTKAYSNDFKPKSVNVTGRGGTRTENGTLIAVYDVVLNEDGTLKEYKRINETDKASGTKWYAYNESATPTPWFNNSPYVDTLNKKAIEKFIETTHEKYYGKFGNEFGKAIPAIFTDEPQFAVKGTLSFADEKKDVFLPWTNSFTEKFKEFCGFDILDSLPELFWEKQDHTPSYTRYKFHDFVTELFVSSYCDTIGSWCNNHNIMFSGHLMHEDHLKTQTEYIGEAMRGYRAFKKMPGMDLLCNRREFNTAKQCTSVMHQQGGEAVMSELYGVTGWDFDFRGHKLQGDWQSALGITVRVPHLTWMSMKGEAKRDYPASIGYQSPWWNKYNIIENHFSRLNTVLTRGKPVVNIAVIHPIESYWINYGPSNQTATIRNQLESNFKSFGDTMLLGLIDFDYISESLFPDLCKKGGYPIEVGKMKYDTIIVPGCQTLRSTTLERLEEFKKAGGNLIFLGDCPKYEDALPSERPKELFNKSKRISFNSADILDALEDKRFIDMKIRRSLGGVAFAVPSGTRTSDMVYQLREDYDRKWLFIAKALEPTTPDVDPARIIKTTLNGIYSVEEYDTLTGKIREIPCKYENGKTVFEKMWYMHDSLLLRLTEGKNEGSLPIDFPKLDGRFITNRVNIELDEPNALLLDMAEYALDNEEYHPIEEFLRLDNECRKKVGIPIRQKAVTQPYKIKPEKTIHEIHLRMTFDSEIHYEGAFLALEEPENTKIVFNGNNITPKPDGWYVDKAIEKVRLSAIEKGKNVLEVTVPLGERTNLEWMYLLGNFGVRVDGAIKTVIKKPTQLAFGNIVSQGLPFYTGNITYEFDVTVGNDGKLAVRTEQYRGALIDVLIDGKWVGNIIFSPYTFETQGLEKGNHKVGLKLYGTRQNGFAQVHHTQGVYFYQSPDSWREGGSLWTYEYQLKPAGILKSPLIFE